MAKKKDEVVWQEPDPVVEDELVEEDPAVVEAREKKEAAADTVRLALRTGHEDKLPELMGKVRGAEKELAQKQKAAKEGA